MTTNPTINPARLERVLSTDFALKNGNHKEPRSEEDIATCVMEAVAYVAGEPWSDHPACACPTLTAFCISLNDNWTDADRQRLKPYIPRMVGTRGPIEVELRRAWMMVDFVCRVQQPILYDAVGLPEAADELRELAEVKDVSSARAALDARTALDASADRAAIDALDVFADRAALDAFAARAALDAFAARAALDAFAARAALDASVARAALDARTAWWDLGVLIAAEAIKTLPAGTSKDAMRDAGVQAINAVAAQVREAELALLDRLIEVR